jgi:hypothetical protein
MELDLTVVPCWALKHCSWVCRAAGCAGKNSGVESGWITCQVAKWQAGSYYKPRPH